MIPDKPPQKNSVTTTGQRYSSVEEMLADLAPGTLVCLNRHLTVEYCARELETMALKETRLCVSSWLPWRARRHDIRAQAFDEAAEKLRADVDRASQSHVVP